jgi:hypothetical protein
MKPISSVCGDGDLVRLLVALAADRTDDVPHRVRPHLVGRRRQFATDDRTNRVLVARHAVRLRELPEEVEVERRRGVVFHILRSTASDIIPGTVGG